MKPLPPFAVLPLLLAALAACGDEVPPAPAPAPFPLRAVVDAELAALDRALAAEEGPARGEPADVEQVHGLLEMLASATGAMREIARQEASGLGDPAVSELARVLADPDAKLAIRVSAVEVLGAIDTPRAAAVLLARMEDPEPLVRAHAAWRLGQGAQGWVVPGLVLRLKYEKDHETVVWIAGALARFGNFAGLGGLETVAATAPGEAVRASAGARIAEILAATSFPDLAALAAEWRRGDPGRRLPAPPSSPRTDREVWRLLSRLREFQLRGVDDARWVVSALDRRAAELTARALHDSEVKTRVHAAQCLERMGPRASVAVDELLAGLAEPFLAPHAADALGAIGDPRAAAPLAALLDPPAGYGLRLAAIRALGRLDADVPGAARDRLRSLFAASETPEVRQAAAESLVRLGEGGDEAVLALADLLVSRAVEPVSSEAVLREHLARRAEAGDEAARGALAEWDARALATDRILAPGEAEASRAARREIVRKLVGGGE
ncbi:MAG: HEAT repeat domain-containing protein [Planctomycetota bacterium]